MINLNNCKPGQKLRARNGDIFTYSEKSGNTAYPHIVENSDLRLSSRVDNGKVHSDAVLRNYDIVEIIEDNNLTNQNMKTEITELENELKLAEEKAANIKIALEAKRKLELEIKAGDYVYCLAGSSLVSGLKTGRIYKVFDLDAFDIWTSEEDKQFDRGWLRKRFRKATREEITKHLLDEAAQKGFIVGAKFEYGKFSTKGSIEKLEVLFDKKDIDSRNNSPIVDGKTDFPFVIVYGKPNGVFPIDKIKIIKDEISIEVNGTKYIAKFIEKEQVVNFGCANIAFSIFESAYKFMKTAVDNPANNRYVESVKIGNGVFSFELIKKINNKILELAIKS